MAKESRPELLFANASTSKPYQREVAAGTMRRIARGIYTPNTKDSLEIIVQRNRHDIIADRFPGSVVTHRSAIEIGAATQPHIYLSGFRAERNVKLPGLTIHVLAGPGALEGDIPFRTFHIASQARHFLENLSPSRGAAESRKTIPRDDLERRLSEIKISLGGKELIEIRDRAKALAPALGLQRELKTLDGIVGAMLATRPDAGVASKQALANARAEPYDIDRIKLFESLALELRSVRTPSYRPTPDIRGDVTTLHTFAFMEAYFSNFIEGTEFEIDEARKIVFEGLNIPKRADDTHDILNTYRLVADTFEMSRKPGTEDQLLELLEHHHRSILEHRKDKNPGAIKTIPNRAGDTRFVEPALVRGTLCRAFQLYRDLSSALARAIFMQVVVSEVHPFDDGNGRLSRIMMNAELTEANECRIIIPTVYRDDYLTALKAFSQAREIQPAIRMFQRAQAFTSSMDYSNYDAAKTSFESANSFKAPRDAALDFEERKMIEKGV